MGYNYLVSFVILCAVMQQGRTTIYVVLVGATGEVLILHR